MDCNRNEFEVVPEESPARGDQVLYRGKVYWFGESAGTACHIYFSKDDLERGEPREPPADPAQPQHNWAFCPRKQNVYKIIPRMNPKVVEKEQEINKLTQQYDKFKNDFELLKQKALTEKSTLEKELQELSQKKKDGISDVKKVELGISKKQTELETLNLNAKQLETTNKTLTATIEANKKNNQELEHEAVKLESSISKRQKELDDISEAHRQELAHLQELVQQIESLDATLRELQQEEAEIWQRRSADHLQWIEKQKATGDARVKQTQQELSRLADELSTIRSERVKEELNAQKLQRELQSLREEKSHIPTRSEGWLYFFKSIFAQ